MKSLDIQGYKTVGIREDEVSLCYELVVEPELRPENCPICNQNDSKRYGVRPFNAVDLPTGKKATHLEIRRQRYRCNFCGAVFSEILPSIESKHRMTTRLIEYIQKQSLLESPAKISEYVHINERTIRDIFNDYRQPKETLAHFPDYLGIHDIYIGRRSFQIVTDIQTETIIDVIPPGRAAFRDYVARILKAEDTISIFFDVSTLDIILDLWAGKYRHLFMVNIYRIIDLEHKVLENILSDILKQNRKRVPPSATIFFSFLNSIATVYSNEELEEKLNSLIAEYEYLSPLLSQIIKIHQLFTSIWQTEDPLRRKAIYKQWEEEVLRTKDLPQEYLYLVRRVRTYRNILLDFSIKEFQNYDLYLRHIGKFYKFAKYLKQEYSIRTLWGLFLGRESDDTTPYARRYFNQMLRLYNQKLAFEKIEPPKRGINIEALTYAISSMHT